MSTVLVTGATTPAGVAMVRRLLDTGAAERVLAVGAEPHAAQLPADARLHYQQVDLTRPRAAHELLWGPARELGVGAIVHAAFHRGIAGDARAELAAQRLHVDATRELVRLAERHPGVRHFVLVGSAAVYRIDHREPNLLDEDAPLDLQPGAPAHVRQRVEADLAVSLRVARSPLQVVVLRCAEVVAPDAGSQMWDYLQSRMCLRPIGFDPMLNLLSIEDVAEAVRLALETGARGVFNVPGADTLPLSRVIAAARRLEVPVPGLLLSPLYRLRARALGSAFRYDLNVRRFHFGALLEGTRARSELGYTPCHPLAWLGAGAR